jgi:mRNA-degrading endonuclease toxin of MazEF toxin-antitoxin module
MGERQAAIRYGRIVYAWVSDRNGYAKLRPALILTPDVSLDSASPIVAAAITTTFPEPPDRHCVKLPWHPSGRVSTGLRQRSAVVTNWLATISPGDVVGYGGDVPRRIMDDIQRKLTELNE